MLVSVTGVTDEHAYLEVFKGQVWSPDRPCTTDIMLLSGFRGLTSITRPGSYRITSMKPENQT